MTDATYSRSRAAVFIPAAYVEDMRGALVAEIENCSGWLTTAQADVACADSDNVESRVGDREIALRSLRQDVDALDQLGEATGDAELTADAATLFHALEAVMRLLAGRLGAELDVRPVDVEAVLELTGRLAWAAAEAKRIA